MEQWLARVAHNHEVVGSSPAPATKFAMMEVLMATGEQRKATMGERRVRVEFNPSASDTVSVIKQRTAELIDICERIKDDGDVRCASLAQTHFEDAAMWAVKAATGGGRNGK